MKKLLFVIVALFVATNCFSEQTTYVKNTSGAIISPSSIGSNTSASSAVIHTGGMILPIGTETNLMGIYISPPIGGVYIGGSSVTGATGLSLSATQPILILNVSDVSNLYWTSSVNGQRLNFIKVY
jgi:hypothetical protein